MLRYENRPALAFVVILILFGFWQHLWFSWTVGEFAFFKNAYDEDTYALFADTLNAWHLDRALSTALFKGLLWISSGSYDFALVAADAALPALAFLAAYYIAVPLFRSAAERVLCALAIIFSPDLFSLGNAVTITSRWFPISALRVVLGDAGERLVPPIETSYINLTKSLEPQLSYIVGFVFVGLLIRLVRKSSETVDWRMLAALATVQALLTLCYSLVSYPMLMLELYVAVLLAFCGAYRSAAILVVLFAASAAAAVLSAMQLLGGDSVMFQSRLPAISVAAVGGLVLCVVIAWALWRVRFSNRLLWLALGFAGLPIATMNQQILTGVMVSTRDWERNINHPALAIAAALFCAGYPLPRLGRFPETRVRLAALAMSVLVLAVVVDGSLRSYGLWESTNVRSVAMARAVDKAAEVLPADMLLVLDDVSLAPLLAARRGGKINFLVDYTPLFLDRIPSTTAADFRVTKHGHALFEYWRLVGKTPTEAEAVLRTEAVAKGGFFSAFFFNICDYWYPCTDSRAVKVDMIAASIPMIIAAYRSYLSAGKSPFASRHLAFVESDGNRRPPAGFKLDPIARETIAGVAASVYVQN